MDNIYSKLSPDMEPAAFGGLHSASPAENSCWIGLEAAHNLNSQLAVVRLCAEQLLYKHRENALIRPQLVILTEKIKVMEALIRKATLLPSPSATP